LPGSVDFLVVALSAADVGSLVLEMLKTSLEDVYEDLPDDADLVSAIEQRYAIDVDDERRLVALTVTFDLEDAQLPGVIGEFARGLSEGEADGILHVVKLRDDAMLARQLVYVAEVYEIEMKVREALTAAYVLSGSPDYYNYLGEADIKWPPEAPPKPDLLRQFFENEFFFLLFSGYSDANSRRQPSNARDLVDKILGAADLGALQLSLAQDMGLRDADAAFVAGLKSLVDPIEKVRNCVAHNRTVSNNLASNYDTARPQVLEAVNEYLDSLGSA
jgi:hypothetical protein